MKPKYEQAPFPWFGGKRRVADIGWQAMGPEADNYIEAFAGSLAMLLGRPGGAGKIETVNDIDANIANFWRAVREDPTGVAAHCDWPVIEVDLHSRHDYLVKNLPKLREKIVADPGYFDSKIAGWWVWGIGLWIGSGWCAPTDDATTRQKPHISARGIHTAEPVTSRRKPTMGVEAWLVSLSTRLRHVRVLSGDWLRVLTDSVLSAGNGITAVFLDPPYEGFEYVYTREVEGDGWHDIGGGQPERQPRARTHLV